MTAIRLVSPYRPALKNILATSPDLYDFVSLRVYLRSCVNHGTDP